MESRLETLFSITDMTIFSSFKFVVLPLIALDNCLIKKQKSCVKRIHLVTNDGSYDWKAFRKVKHCFYSSPTFVSQRVRMMGGFDSRKYSHHWKFEQRPRILVKLSFRKSNLLFQTFIFPSQYSWHKIRSVLKVDAGT